MGWQSGSLFAFDFESAEAYASFQTHELIDGTALGELVSKAWCARTPRGGRRDVRVATLAGARAAADAGDGRGGVHLHGGRRVRAKPVPQGNHRTQVKDH